MYKILVVDDEQDLCDILQFNLQNQGYEVTTVNSAEEALAWLLSFAVYTVFMIWQETGCLAAK